MKIQKIYIKNINSLAGENTIDFTLPPLSTAALFAITGPTGAGKSTVLDVICLALYDQCPRVSKANRSTIENSGAIITRGAAESEAMVEYKQEDKIYRSKWTIQFNRNRNLNERKMELSQYDASKDQWSIVEARFSQVPEKNAEITNLDYGQFTRSILLAQGEFAKLLTSRKEERFALMEKITGEDTYRKLGKKIYETAKIKADEIAAFGAELNNMQFLTEEEKAEINNQLAELIKVILDNDSAIKKLTELINTKEQLATKEEQVIKLSDSLQKLEIENENFSTDHKRLIDFENVRSVFPLIAEQDSLKKQLSELEKSKKHAITNLLQLEAAYLDKETQWKNKLNKEFNRENCIEVLSAEFKKIKEKQDEYIKARDELNAAKKEEENALKSLEAIKNNLKITNNRISERDQVQQTLDTQLKAYSSYTESFKTFDVWKNNHNRLVESAEGIQKENGQNLKEEVSVTKSFLETQFQEIENMISAIEVNGNINDINAQLSTVERNKPIINAGLEALLQIVKLKKETDIKKASIFSDKQQILKLDSSIKELELKLEKLEKDKELSSKLVKLADAALHFESIRAYLAEGDPCPLCGSKEHPGIDDNDYEALQKKDEEIKKEIQSENAILKELNNKKIKSEHSVKSNEDTIIDLQKSIEETENNKLKHVGQLLNITLPEITAELLSAEQITLNKNYESLQNIQQELNKLSELLPRKVIIKTNLEKCNEWLTEWNSFINTIQVESSMCTRNEVNSFMEALEEKKKIYDELSKKNELLLGELNKLQATIEPQISSEEKANQELANRTIILNTNGNFFNNCKIVIENLPKIGDASVVAPAEISTITELITRIQSVTAAKSDFEEKLNIKKAEHEQKEEALNTIIHEKGYESSEQILLLNITAAEEKNIRDKKQSLEKEKTVLTTEQGTVKKDIEILKSKNNPEKEVDSVRLDLEEIKLKNDAEKEQKWKLDEKLATDTKLVALHKEKYTQLEDMKKAANPYLNLNKLIGDAEGKRFNEFAQELTLRKLLVAANANLEIINPRYQLDTYEGEENSDSLYVIDRFMGDSRRAASLTFSGGETFMASLSLALGLSDLSSGKAELGNLFIDEGFGSLDQESLDYSINMLEELQHRRGRVIGVISHVSELKEKIQTQITIEKRAGGTSVILPFS